MDFKLLTIEDKDLAVFKRDMQEAFQLGAMAWEDNLEEEILPESHIDRSLSAKGSIAYKAVMEGHMCGGAIVVLIQGTCIFILTAVAFQLWNFIIPSTWIQMHLMVMMERICSLDLRRGVMV